MQGMEKGPNEHDPTTDRPWVVKAVEATALVSFVILQVTGWTLIRPFDLIEQSTLLSHSLFVAIAVLSWMSADLVSGIAHFLADNYGSEDTPWVGPALIRPFREHHQAPFAMLQHGFLERNGNSALISLPTIAWIPFVPEGPLVSAVAAGVLMMTLWVLWTNQIHAWAHSTRRPGWVRLLQAWGVLLSPEHHEVHHAPFSEKSGPSPDEPTKAGLARLTSKGGNYCITSGVCDRVLTLSQRSERPMRPASAAAGPQSPPPSHEH
jgi:ubiquitin-conjugating enzyme E2 variant